MECLRPRGIKPDSDHQVASIRYVLPYNMLTCKIISVSFAVFVSREDGFLASCGMRESMPGGLAYENVALVVGCERRLNSFYARSWNRSCGPPRRSRAGRSDPVAPILWPIKYVHSCRIHWRGTPGTNRPQRHRRVLYADVQESDRAPNKGTKESCLWSA